MAKIKVVSIPAPKCFSEHPNGNKCNDCIFLFDCLEKKAERK